MKWAENENDPVIKQFLRDYLEMLSEMDTEVLNEAKGRDPEMAKAWREIFGVDEEINSAVTTAVDNTTRTIYFESVQDGQMQLNYAAKKSNMSTADFSTAMTNAGYKLPQTV